MSPLKHSLPQGAHGKLYVSTKRIMPWSLQINTRTQEDNPPSTEFKSLPTLQQSWIIRRNYTRIGLANYGLTIFARVLIWSEVEKLLETSSQLFSFSFHASLALQMLSATLFFSKPERSSSSPHSLFTVDTIRRCCGVTLHFTWYHGNALATTAPRKCRKWLPNNFDYKEHEQLHSSAAMSFSNACNEVIYFIPFWQGKFLSCVSFNPTVGWGSFVVYGVATWTHVQGIPPAADSRGFCEPDSRETWKQQHWKKVQCSRYNDALGLPCTFVVIFICVVFKHTIVCGPVAASGLGAYFLDGNSFLSKLCKCANEEERDT